MGRTMRLLGLAALVVASTTACAPARSSISPALPSLSLAGTDGKVHAVPEETRAAPLTVLVFFSAHCNCLEKHEARLRELYEVYQPRGVQFAMVDSEVGASEVRDAAEARSRAYPFPILIDPGAKLADALGAEYATYSVVVDAHGVVRYRGGIDSDKTHLHEDATMFLRNALDDVLGGREPRVAEGKALGCALQKW